MPHSKYLIVGSSHAALEAVTAIRLQDADGSITMVTRDSRLPYSPTILPYIVSGRSRPDNVMLRDAAYFAQNNVDAATQCRIGRSRSGAEIRTHRVRRASGPTISYCWLRAGRRWFRRCPASATWLCMCCTRMDDAIRLHDAIGQAKSAIVLGAGLCGMHVAENMAKAG